MERRSFIKGIFGGVAATGLIIKASAEDITKFASSNPEGTGVVSVADDPVHVSGAFMQTGEVLYSHDGKPVGVFTGYETKAHMVDMASMNDNMSQFIVNTREVRGHFIVQGIYRGR